MVKLEAESSVKLRGALEVESSGTCGDGARDGVDDGVDDEAEVAKSTMGMLEAARYPLSGRCGSEVICEAEGRNRGGADDKAAGGSPLPP